MDCVGLSGSFLLSNHVFLSMSEVKAASLGSHQHSAIPNSQSAPTRQETLGNDIAVASGRAAADDYADLSLLCGSRRNGEIRNSMTVFCAGQRIRSTQLL